MCIIKYANEKKNRRTVRNIFDDQEKSKGNNCWHSTANKNNSDETANNNYTEHTFGEK